MSLVYFNVLQMRFLRPSIFTVEVNVLQYKFTATKLTAQIPYFIMVRDFSWLTDWPTKHMEQSSPLEVNNHTANKFSVSLIFRVQLTITGITISIMGIILNQEHYLK